MPESRPRLIVTMSDVAWRSLVIAAAVVAVAYLLAKLRVVVLPVFVATLLSTVLVPPARWLQRHGWRPLLATAGVFLGLLVLLVGVLVLIVPAITDEFDQLGPTISEAADDIEEWLIEGPADLEPAQVDDYREQLREQTSDVVASSGSGVVAGAVLFVEIVAGGVLALVLTFFFVKDGRLFQEWALRQLPERHHDVARAAAAKAWRALGGYLRGAAAIGLLEAVILGVTIALVGGRLAVPVAVITFLAAFFPIVGAVVAGILAALVTLVTAGFTEAIIVAVVALVVQQFDNDLLAPMVYGHFIRLHPVVVLLSLAAGGALAGIAGAFLAVPLVAMAVPVATEIRDHRRQAVIIE